MNNKDTVLETYYNSIKHHDYSYMYSDDNRWWDEGVKSEKIIKELINTLCSIYKLDAKELLSTSLSHVGERYVNGLTHNTINKWFKPYIN